MHSTHVINEYIGVEIFLLKEKEGKKSNFLVGIDLRVTVHQRGEYVAGLRLCSRR